MEVRAAAYLATQSYLPCTRGFADVMLYQMQHGKFALKL